MMAIMTVWTESSWAFPKSYTANDSRIGVLRTPPRWVSAHYIYVWVSAQQQSWQCSQNLSRPFLRAV